MHKKKKIIKKEVPQKEFFKKKFHDHLDIFLYTILL